MSDQTYVSLDLETTGLDLEKDHIIEIGALKFKGNEVVGTFETLVNPHRPLPFRIQMLTGISAEELNVARSFPAVAPGLVDFVSDHPVIGQNVHFDLDFLRAQGLEFRGPIYDILDVANILLPQLPDYSLVTLADRLEVPYPVRHRALADATIVKDVFLAILDRASDLDLPLIAEINRLTLTSGWPWRVFFGELEELKIRNISLWDRQAWESDFIPRRARQRAGKALSARPVIRPLDVDGVASLIREDGSMARLFPGFEFRQGQVSMLQGVTRALNCGQHFIVEAGTGIGKSVAYLLPAILFAWENNTPVVISTDTINLQEQLMNKDIPDLLKVLEEAGMQSPARHLKVAQLKGRSNYLCLRRWNALRKSPGLTWEDTRALLRLLLWVSSTESGDRAELNLSRAELDLWNRICASEEGCASPRCPYHDEKCFLYTARQEAQGAHLIVVNHSLLLSDLTRGRILPDYRYLVIDEAHHLEEEATEQLGYVVRSRDLLNRLDLLTEKGGFLGGMRRHLRSLPLASSTRKNLGNRLTDLKASGVEARRQAVEFWNQLILFVRSHHPAEPGDYERHLRITREVRRHPGWAETRSGWELLDSWLVEIESDLGDVLSGLESFVGTGGSETQRHLADALSLRQEIATMRRQIDGLISKPEINTICWISATAQEECRLHAAPLDVGRPLDEYLFSRKDSVVLTSATLAVGGDFGYFQRSVGLEEADILALDAPFDYVSSTLVYLPQDMAEPERAGYQHAVAQATVDLCRATEGHALALFTSHAALRAAYGAVQAPLEDEGILVMGQGIDGGPKKLLARFRENPRSLLMGTAAFWEGIDVVGPALSVLIIVRLPFGVPTDPIAAARAEQFDDPFNQYTVPRAALKFKQGFGRLIRSQADRGAVVILDRRIQTKSYGRVFLQSLPKCTLRTGLLRQMPQDVLSWLNQSPPP